MRAWAVAMLLVCSACTDGGEEDVAQADGGQPDGDLSADARSDGGNQSDSRPGDGARSDGDSQSDGAVVAVSVTPASVAVPSNGTQQFSSTVTGTTNLAVTWSVQESGCGTVSSGSGLYTAPGSPRICHVAATSVADTTKSGTAEVTVVDGVLAADYYVSPNGNDVSNDGKSLQSPFASLNRAWQEIAPGNLVYVLGGTYAFSAQQHLTGKSGTAGHLIRVWAYPGQTPVITRAASSTVEGVYFRGDYCHFKGLEITGFHQFDQSLQAGFMAEDSNHNIFELLNVHHNGAGMWVFNDSDDNLVLNCDFHHNWDPFSSSAYGDADGFGTAFTGAGTTTTISGCRAWYNSDDGYDYYNTDGYIITKNSWAWANGYREDGTTPGGDGNGIKLGITPTAYPTTLRREVTGCLFFHNLAGGISHEETNCVIELFNNTVYHNGDGGKWQAGIELGSFNLPHIIRNNISFAHQSGEEIRPLFSNLVQDHNSWNGGVTVSSADFISVDMTGVDGPRQADGSLPAIDFLHLATGSDLINAGVVVNINGQPLPYNGAAPDLGAFEY
jgi:hypothetical protein